MSQNNNANTDFIENSSRAIAEVFQEVRDLLLENAGKVEFSTKEDGSPLTEIDLQVEKIVQSRVQSQFPDIPILGEESGYDAANLPKTCWLIDPIDGTKSFIKNTGTFTCMAVLIHDGQAASSIIYNPTTDTMYTASKNGGAFKNGLRLNLSSTPQPHAALCKSRYSDSLADILRGSDLELQTGVEGAGYSFIMVAEGSIAAAFKLASLGYVHDYACGALIVHEAGGALIPILEDTYSFRTRSFVACHPQLADMINDKRMDIRALEDSDRTAL